VVVATVLGLLIVLGLAPFDLRNNASSLTTVILVMAIDISLSAAAILKGKPLLGLIGIFVPFASILAVARLASPTSWWARRVYKPGRKHERAQARWMRIDARRRRLGDAVAGTPSDELAPASQITSTDRSAGPE
jgi:hypothetical protein